MSWRSPVLVIGLDAATWEVIEPLMAAGRLPNLESLMREGASGPLRSIVRYPSPALWTTIITGRLPEEHGVQDFYSATRTQIRVPTLYDILEGDSGSIGLFRWHATWPPLTNTKFCVPAYTARSPETHPAQLRFLNDLARPQGLRSYLQGGLRTLQHGARLRTLAKSVGEIVYELAARPEQKEWWYRRRLLESAIYGDVFAYLLRRHKPDFSAVLFSVIDDFGHHYWKYREPELFEDVTEEEARKYGPVIDQAYMAVDRALGVILGALPDDLLVFVVSDHGQGPISPIVRPYRISAQKLANTLGFTDKVWVTDLGYSALFRPRSPEDGDKVLGQLRDMLAEIRLQEDGRPVFRVSPGGAGSVSVTVAVGRDVPLESAVVQPVGHLGDLVYTRGEISGHHTEQGIIIAKGPGVRAGHQIRGAGLMDVTPTLLALKGQPVRTVMGGRVLTEIIEDSFLDRYPVTYTEPEKSPDGEAQDLPFTEDELALLESKLRSLGYLS